MFIRYATNTKKLYSATDPYEYGLKVYTYEINHNGIHFAYEIGRTIRARYVITQITFMDALLCIMLFTTWTPYIYKEDAQGVLNSIAYERGTGTCVPTGAHHDLLRSLRTIELVKN